MILRHICPSYNGYPKIQKISFWASLIWLINIVIDTLLTHMALSRGYYETNGFTVRYGLIPHMCILIIIMYIMYRMSSLSDYKISVGMTSGTILLTILWIANNVYSIILLI